MVSAGHHERVAIVGQQHESHAGEEHVVLKAQQARCRAMTVPEVSGAEYRDTGRRGAEQKQKEARERIAPNVHGQVWQADQ